MPSLTFKKSVLDDIGDQFATPGSPAWARWFLGMAKLRRHDLQCDATGLKELMAKLKKHEAWKALGFASFTMLCFSELELDGDEVEAVLSAKKGVSVASVIRTARNTKPLAAYGEIGNGRSRVDNIKPTDGGTSTDYLSARIARDRPDILERMKAGDFRSVRQAAIEAGIVKVKSNLEKLRGLWSKLPERDRKRFLDWIAENEPVGVV